MLYLKKHLAFFLWTRCMPTLYSVDIDWQRSRQLVATDYRSVHSRRFSTWNSRSYHAVAAVAGLCYAANTGTKSCWKRCRCRCWSGKQKWFHSRLTAVANASAFSMCNEQRVFALKIRHSIGSCKYWHTINSIHSTISLFSFFRFQAIFMSLW